MNQHFQRLAACCSLSFVFLLFASQALADWHASNGTPDIAVGGDVLALDTDSAGKPVWVERGTGTGINLKYYSGGTIKTEALSHTLPALDYYNEPGCTPSQGVGSVSIVVNTTATTNTVAILLGKSMTDSCGNAAPLFQYCVVELGSTPSYLVSMSKITREIPYSQGTRLGNPLRWYDGADCVLPTSMSDHNFDDFQQGLIDADNLHIEEGDIETTAAFTNGSFWFACSYSVYIEQELNSSAESYEEHIASYVFQLNSSFTLIDDVSLAPDCDFGSATPAHPPTNQIELAGIKDSYTNKYILLYRTPFINEIEVENVGMPLPTMPYTLPDSYPLSFKVGDGVGKLCAVSKIVDTTTTPDSVVLCQSVYTASTNSWSYGSSGSPDESPILGADIAGTTVTVVTSWGDESGTYIYGNGAYVGPIVEYTIANGSAPFSVNSAGIPYVFLEYGVEGTRGKIKWYKGILTP